MNKYLEKVAAEKKKDSWRDPGRVGVGIAAGMAATPLLTLPAIPMANKVEKMVDSDHSHADLGTIKKMMRDNKLNTTFNTREHNVNKQIPKSKGIAEGFKQILRNAVEHHDGPAYVNNKDGKNFVVGVKKKNMFTGTVKGIKNKDVIMHELGHAKDFSTRTALKANSLHAGRVGRLAAYGALSNDKTEKYAVPLAAASTLPELRSEGMANYHAYHGIKAHKGAAAANKYLKHLVPAQMGAYAAAGAASVGGVMFAKHIINKLKSPQAKNGR